MTKTLGSFLNPEGHLRVIGARGLNIRGKIDKVLDKVTKQKTYKRLQKSMRQSMTLIRAWKKWNRRIPGRHPRLLQRSGKGH
jgi:hypothetical protein